MPMFQLRYSPWSKIDFEMSSVRRKRSKRGPIRNGLSVTYAVSIPASSMYSVKTCLWAGIGLQPGNCGSFGATFQSRNGNERVPVRSARRTATVGMASGTARSKRSPSLASASRFGVSASSSPSYALTKSRRVLSVTIRSDVQRLALARHDLLHPRVVVGGVAQVAARPRRARRPRRRPRRSSGSGRAA